MQKLDFVNRLKVLIDGLRSQPIVELLSLGFKSPTVQHDFKSIINFLFQSKSFYDRVINEEEYHSILSGLDLELLYEGGALANIVQILTTAPQGASLVYHRPIIELYATHNTLISMLKLAQKVLVDDILIRDYEEILAEGIIVFQLVNNEYGVEADKYVKILSAIEELVSVVAKIVGETEEVDVILLDSGSDTNIGIKTGIETAKSLFSIFKEMWDYYKNSKFYQQKQRNTALLESLDLRAKIQQQMKDGLMTEEEAKSYNHFIKTRTDDLIGMKVLPKQLVLESNIADGRKLLENIDDMKLLGTGFNKKMTDTNTPPLGEV